MKIIRRIINISSIIFLGLLVALYGYRLVYYYKLEHQNNSNEVIKFYQKLINNKGIEGMNYGLQKEENGYIFGPKSTDNYVLYAGRLWRIISIDENNNIKLITEESQTILPWEENKTFSESNINSWLNDLEIDNSGIFEKSLKNTTNNIKINGNIATLLTKKEYEKIGKDSYITDSINYWIIDEENDTRSYVNINGEIIDEINNFDTFNIRPIIVINNEFNYIDGTGTKDNPYIIVYNEKTNLSDTFVGEYLNYNNLLWRIIETDDDKIKIVLDDNISEDQIFSEDSNIFSLDSGIGKYLNDDYYNSLSDNDYIKEGKFYIGNFSVDDEYSYLNTYEDFIEANIGLYKIGDFFINTGSNFYTLTPSETAAKVIYVVNKNKRLYADFVNEKYDIKPVLYLDSKIFILSGNGTKMIPYEIGR